MHFPWRKITQIGLNVGGMIVPGVATVAGVIENTGLLNEPTVTSSGVPALGMSSAIETMVEIIEGHAAQIPGPEKENAVVQMAKIAFGLAGVKVDSADIDQAIRSSIQGYVAYKDAEAAWIAGRGAVERILADVKAAKG